MLQHITQSLEDVPWKHISFDHVVQLEKQAIEVQEEVVQVQGILKEFQDKVSTMAQLVPET